MRTGPDSLLKVQFLTIDQHTFSELSAYIDSYEHILLHSRSYSQQILAGWVGLAPGARRPDHGTKVKLIMNNGEEINSFLFCASSSTIALSSQDFDYAPTSCDKLRLIPCTQISSIRIDNARMGQGLLFGGVAGALLVGGRRLAYEDRRADDDPYRELAFGVAGGALLGVIIRGLPRPTVISVNGNSLNDEQLAILKKRSSSQVVPPELCRQMQ